MVDQRWQQRREDAGDDAACGSGEQAVAGSAGGSDRLRQRSLLVAASATPSTTATEIEGNGRGESRVQVKAAPTRRLTRRWPFCCQVDQPRTGYAARRTSFNATLSFAFRFLTR